MSFESLVALLEAGHEVSLIEGVGISIDGGETSVLRYFKRGDKVVAVEDTDGKDMTGSVIRSLCAGLGISPKNLVQTIDWQANRPEG